MLLLEATNAILLGSHGEGEATECIDQKSESRLDSYCDALTPKMTILGLEIPFSGTVISIFKHDSLARRRSIWLMNQINKGRIDKMTKRLFALLILCVASLILYSCATRQHRTEPYRGDYNKVFISTMEAIKENGFNVKRFQARMSAIKL